VVSPGSRRVAVGIVLSVCLSLWFLASIHWQELGAALATVKAGPVALACGLLVMEFVLRAARWKVLLRPAAPEAKVRELFAATVIGAAANTLLPARAGEIAKPLVAARRAGVNITTAVATAVMERVYDIFGLLSVLLTMAILLPDQVADTSEEAVLVVNLKRYGALFGAVGLTAMAIFFTLAMRGGAARAIFAKIASLGPAPLRDRVMGLYDGFVAGLGNARDPPGPAPSRRALADDLAERGGGDLRVVLGLWPSSPLLRRLFHRRRHRLDRGLAPGAGLLRGVPRRHREDLGAVGGGPYPGEGLRHRVLGRVVLAGDDDRPRGAVAGGPHLGGAVVKERSGGPTGGPSGAAPDRMSLGA
jgi:hypothetical protein